MAKEQSNIDFTSSRKDEVDIRLFNHDWNTVLHISTDALIKIHLQ